MAKNILLIGLRRSVLDVAEHQLEGPDIQIFEAIDIEEVRSTLVSVDIDHVITGAGIDLETRLQIVREIFQRSEKATVHMKNHAGGPQSLVPFAQGVLRGMKDYNF